LTVHGIDVGVGGRAAVDLLPPPEDPLAGGDRRDVVPLGEAHGRPPPGPGDLDPPPREDRGERAARGAGAEVHGRAGPVEDRGAETAAVAALPGEAHGWTSISPRTARIASSSALTSPASRRPMVPMRKQSASPTFPG